MNETMEMLSLGQQLKNGREALNLSIADVAQKTNLKKSHIEALENDIFILQNVPPAFVRGYVRSYVRFLRLPDSLIQTVNYGEVTIPKDVKKAQPIKVSHNQKSHLRWLKVLTWLILLSAAGMTLAWWWQEYQKDEQNRASLVNTQEVVAENTPVAQTTEQPLVLTPEPSQNESSSAPQPATSITETTENTAVPAVPANPPATPEISHVAPIVINANTNLENTSANSTTTPVANVENNLPVAEEKAPEEKQEANNNAELRIEIVKAQSWITVRSENGKRSLAEKLYSAGEVLTFNEAEAYRVTVGAPAYVKVYYKGQEVPMKLDGRVARLKFPQ